MSFERIKLTLYNAQQGHVAYSGAWAQMKPALLYGNRLSMVVTEETRRDNHNRHFHKLIGVIAEQDQVLGKALDAESWKRLLVDAFKHDTKDDDDLKAEWAKFGEIRLLPALNHPGFVMCGEQTRTFTIKLARAFIEWLYAFGAERGIRFPTFEHEEEMV